MTLDGFVRLLPTRGSPQRREPNDTETYEVVAEFSERREAEVISRHAPVELARMSRLTIMGELAGSIIHEINQPLTAIVTNAEACLRFLDLDVPDLDETRAAIADLARDSRRLSDVVHSLRALARKSGPVNGGGQSRKT